MAITVQCHSLALERSILNTILRKGAIMLEESNNILKGDGTHFYIPEHQIIYNAMCVLYDNKRNVDSIILNEHLKLTKQFNPEVTTVLQRISQSKLVEDFKSSLQILLDYSLRRRVGNLAFKVANECMVDGVDVQELAIGLSDVSNILGISEDMNTEEVSSIAERALESIQTRVVNAKNNITPGVQTYLRDVDKAIGGLVGNTLIVLAGRPATGKTSLALTIAINVAIRQNPVLVFSLEMSKAQLIDRLISYRLRIPSNSIRDGKLNECELEYIKQNIADTTDIPLIIDDNANSDLFDIRNTIRHHVRNSGVKLVVIDYLQLIKPPNAQSREREVAMITRQLKLCAKEFDIPIIVLAQLNRNSEMQKRDPDLSDLRESGSIEQDADMVWFLTNTKPIYNQIPIQLPDDAVKFIIGKFRNGTTGNLPLRFVKKYVSYFDIDYDERDEEIRLIDTGEEPNYDDDYFAVEDEEYNRNTASCYMQDIVNMIPEESTDVSSSNSPILYHGSPLYEE